MPDWLGAALPVEGELPVAVLVTRLLAAAVAGVAVAGVYFRTQGKNRGEAAPFVATLVLLTVLLALVTLVIGNSVARAFGLVGALSIVRFRTVVDDTRDTAFVVFAVVTGMAVGAGFPLAAAVGVPVVAAVAWALAAWGRRADGPPQPGTLVVRLTLGRDPHTAFAEVFARDLAAFTLVGVTTARNGAAVDLTYRASLRVKESAVSLIDALNRVEGVQSVDWKDQPGP